MPQHSMPFGSCQPGHTDWVSTTSGACFVSARGNSFETCFCPISSCVPSGDSYSCEFTILSKAILIVSFVILLLLVGAYVFLVKLWGNDDKHSIETSVEAFWAYTDKMFGVYHANADDDEEMNGAVSRAASKPREDERKPLVDPSSNQTNGTFES